MRLTTLTKILATAVLTFLLASAALADTLVLKNGSVLKGTFVGFENGVFLFKITSGGDSRNRGRTLRFPANDVTKLTLDSDGVDPDTNRDPNTGGGSGGGMKSYPPVEVRLDDQWIRSNIEVRTGQRIRVEASGTIRLEGRTSTGPEGLRNRADNDAPEPNEADGILLAGVGSDANSPSIVIGRQREFVADRDGMLYFTVNHGVARNATGAFSVRVEVEQRSSGGNPGGGNPGGGNTGGGQRGQERTFTLQANQPWFDTGIAVEPGLSFEITAEGTIEIFSGRRTGPEGDRNAQASNSRYPVAEAGVGALLTRIRYRDGRESNILVVGRANTATAEAGEYGRLLLGINDDFFRDNNGSFTVRVRW